MNGLLKKSALAGAVLLYVLAVTLTALHYRFPYQAAFEAARRTLEARSPLRIAYDGIQPGLPLTYEITGLAVSARTPAGDIKLADIDRVRLRLGFFSLLTGRASLAVKALAGQGGLNGQVDYRLWGNRELRLVLDNIDLPDFSLAQPSGQGAIQGRLAGSLTVLGAKGVVPTGGQGSLVIGPGRIDDLQLPQLPISSLEFDRLSLEFKLQPNVVELTGLQAEGQQGVLSLSGRINDFQNLRLSLAGSARLGSAEQPLAQADFRVLGTATNPRVKITSMKGPGGLPIPQAP